MDPDGPPRCALVLFAKQPVPGRVKTRLARAVGEARAADLYERVLRHTVECALRAEVRADCLVAYAHPGEETWFQALDAGLRAIPQTEGDLGARMLGAFRQMAEIGYEATVIVGTDCPALQPYHLQRAVTELARRDLVLGPTWDGGYYAIGARAPHPDLFENIPWSTDEVLPLTRSRIRKHGLTCVELPRLRDVDDEGDLQYYAGPGGAMVPDTMREAFRPYGDRGDWLRR